jgi:betaine-homocysteine S-methyltransferase
MRPGPGLLQRLQDGAVICAEGYLFEFERRGYLQAGAYVPEIVLEHPELVAGLHREFVHAGSDVVEAFTYYAHREKMRIVGKEHLIEPLNRDALSIAVQVARETGCLAAGDICNTNAFYPDAVTRREVRAMFEEQAGWIVEAGMDYVVAETFSWGEEALLALEVIKEADLPAVVTLAIHRAPGRFPPPWSRSPAIGMRSRSSGARPTTSASGIWASAAAPRRISSAAWPRPSGARLPPVATAQT